MSFSEFRPGILVPSAAAGFPTACLKVGGMFQSQTIDLHIIRGNVFSGS